MYGFVRLPHVLVLPVLLAMLQFASAQPVVVTQPRDTSICVESSAGFSIVAVNTTSYQWQENDGVGWYNIDPSFTYINGEYTPDLTIIDANLALNGYQYRCVVSDVFNDKDTSLPAVLGVYDPPIITSDPANQRVCKSEVALFSVGTFNGTDFQWQEHNTVGWLDIEDNSFYGGAQTPDLSVYTVVGMNGYLYRCIVKNVSCPDTSGFANLIVDPTPILFNVTGGGEYCEGDQGVTVGLAGSEMGILYNLLRDGVETGIVEEGTGQDIDFGLQLLEGTYTVVAYNQFTSCSSNMSGEAIVVVNPLPIDYPVQGGGTICMGEAFPDVFLLNSEIGVGYSLFHNAQYTGITVSGTGYGLSFGPQQNAGIYTVVAENDVTGCSIQMSGIAEIIILELPVADAGSDHSIVQGSFAELQGSATGGSGNYNYQWSPSNLCVSPTTASTRTNNLYISTIFTLEVTDEESGCKGSPDTSIVYVSNGPLNVQVFSSNNNICVGESVALIALAGGGTGNYSYVWTSSPPGFMSTLPNPVVTPTESTVYTVVINDGIETVIGTVSIEVFPLPASFTISSGGNFCMGGDGIEISLSGSETGIRYSLYYQQSQVDNMIGTGQQLNFGSYVQQGDYSIIGRNDNTGCASPQNGIATIIANELPVAEAGPDFLIAEGETATLDGSASGGTGGHVFSWNPATMLMNPSVPDPTTVPLNNTTMFNLLVIDGVGCRSLEDNAIVFVSGGQVTLNVFASGDPVCPGGEVQLYAMASGGSGSFSYLWQSNPAGFASTSFNPIVFPVVTTTYIVTANDGLAVLTDSVTVVVNPAPAVFMLSGGGEVCEGDDPLNIVLQGSETGVDYSLLCDGANTGMTLSGTGFALDFGTWNTNGDYSAFAVNPSSLCENDMAGNAVVAVNPLPVASAGPDRMIAAGSTTTLTGSASGGAGTYDYQWLPSYLCVSPSSQNTLTQPLSQTTLFTLVASDAQTQCASLPDTVLVFTSGGDALYVDISATPGTLCSGGELALVAIAGGGTGNYSYSWSSMPVGLYSSQSFLITYPLVSTVYYLDVFDGLAHAYDTIFIEVLPAPAMFEITGGGSFCDGGDGVQIGLSGSETGAAYSLFRSPNVFVSELNGTGQPLDFEVFTQSGTYYSTSVLNGYCEGNMIGESVVVVNQNPVAEAGDDQAIPYNTQAMLNGDAFSGSGDYAFSWSPPDSLINANVQQPQTVPLHSTTMFNLLVTDNATGCNSVEDNTIVFVSGGTFTLQLTSDASSMCPGEETQLYALASGGTGNYSFSWTSDPSGFISASCCPIVSPMVSTIYHVEVSDGSSTLDESISITVNPLPLAYSLSGGGEVCFGQQPNDIMLQNSEANTTYSLLRDGATTGIDKIGTGFPLNFGAQSGNGQYSVFATENTTQCANYMAGEVSVIINALPVVDAGNDVIVPANSTTTLSGEVVGGSGSHSYNWQPAVLCQNPQYQTTVTNPIPQTTLFEFNATNLQTQCVSENDTVFVFTTGGDLSVIAASSAASICNNEYVTLLALPNGGTGSYSFSWTSDPPGFNSSQMTPVAQPVQSTMYYVEVFDGVDHAYDSVYVQVSPLPVVYTVTGGGDFCFGDNGVDIGLDGSEQNLLYRLFHFPDNPLTDVIGTGNELSFGTYSEQGEYYVVANADNTCQGQMNGTATVVVNQLPEANAGDDKLVAWLSWAVLNGSAIGGSGTYNFSWAPPDSLVNPLYQEPTTIPLHNSTLFNLNVIDAATGCYGTDDNAVVFVSGGPFTLVVSTLYEIICQGGKTQLFAIPSGGSGNYTYSWQSDPPGFSSNIFDPIVHPIVATTYTVTVNDGSNTITDSIIINVNAAPLQHIIFGGGTYCDGNSGNEILLDGSDEAVNYELFNDVGSTGIIVPGSGDTINFGFHTEAGYYWAVGTSINNGCQTAMEDTVQVSIAELPLAYAGMDQFIVQGTSAQLEGDADGGSGYYNYNWFPDYLLVNPYVQNPVTVPLDQSTLFMLAVDDANSGCVSNTDSVVVYVIGTELTVEASAAPMFLCGGGEVNLSAVPSGGTGNYSYSWHSVPAGFYSNIPFPIAFPDESITYIIEVNDGDTIVSDSVSVEVIPSPEAFELLGGGSYCKRGEGVNISLSGSQEFVEYTLYRIPDIEVVTLIGDGMPIDFGEFKTEGNYIVLASDPETGCTAQMTGSATVNQYPQPIANAGTDITVPTGSHATLNGSASNGFGPYSYLWMPSEKLLNPTDPDATTVALDATTMFSLQVTDETTSCQSSLSNMIVFVSGGLLTVDVVVGNNQVCPGEQISIYALPGGGSGNYSYFWESLPSGFNATSSQITVSPGETTWYKVTVTDGDAAVSDSVLINTLPLPQQFALLGGGGYCSGFGGVDVYLESSSMSIMYSLFHNTVPTGQYVFGTGSQISFGNMMTEGNYSVMAQNENGCTSLMKNVVQVYLHPLPGKFQLYGGGTYCENDPTLGILLESSELGVDYELYKDAVPTSVVEHGSGLPIGFNGFAGTGNYSVVATGTETGCVATMYGVAGLIIHDKPDIEIFGENKLCLGDAITLSGSGGFTYEWNTVPPQYTPAITVSPTETTVYTLLGYNLNACSDTATHLVEVNEKPVISVVDDPVLLSVVCYPGSLFNYDFYIGDVLIQEGPQNSWYYGDIGIIPDTVFVVAKNESGCTDMGWAFVEVKDPPNAFTPDGDGINDVFLEGRDITVYSSWGGEIFKGDTGWDGKHNGSLVVPGTYYYVHHVYNADGSIIKTIKGSVTVVIE